MNHEGDDLEVVRRLRALAERPVEPGTAGRVLARAQRAPASRWRTTRLKVAAATAGGFLVGSMGLASAGTLPNPVQDVAHSALGAVGISVPPGHDRYNGPECGGTYANHGEYVRAHPDDPAAGRSPCGKPKRGAGGGQPAAEASDRRGSPPWAQGNGQGKAKGKDKAKAPGGDKAKASGGDEAEDEREAPTAPTTTAAPPTTAGPATTTTAPTTTPPTTAAPTTTSTSTASTSTSTSTSEPPTTTTVP